ncbi:S8 family peptidase [Clostridium tunisiense]|uniref:S8 family peptidase n=1 Tax=Clostridium tunisiense TaxID=219748 RepID=UPI000C1FC6F6|nr:S8 family peptidase [Clostridium tunisiense]
MDSLIYFIYHSEGLLEVGDSVMFNIGEKPFGLCLKNTRESEEQIGITPEEAEKYYFDENYQTYFVEYVGDLPSEINNVDFAHLFSTNRFFAILFVKKGMISEVLKRFPQIINLERSAPFTLFDLYEDGNVADVVINRGDTTLDGTGVIVAIVGTGIDYLNPRFMNSDNTTRIITIWDQSINEGNTPPGLVFGTQFTRENINEAIKASESGQNPYEVVSHKDETGYGTAIAGIVGGRNLRDMDIITSFAPNCEFIIVKLKPIKKSNAELWGIEDYENSIYDSNDIVAAFRYLDEIQQRLRRPLVVYSATGTNLGGHDGGAIAERYIDSITNNRNFTFVTSTGNQGDRPIHLRGSFSESDTRKEVQLQVGEEQKNLNFFLYVIAPDQVSIGIISPTGEKVEKVNIQPINGQEISLSLGESRITIQYFTERKGPGVNRLDQRLDFFIRNAVGGIWTIIIFGEYLFNGEYDLWLEQKQFLKEGTGFIGAIPNTTLMTPATSQNIIVCASYNQLEGKVFPESGKGFTRDGRIVPTIAIPGKTIRTIGVNNKSMVVSGTAVAGAILTGIVTLMYQWGIILGNDINIYYSKIKSYLISAAEREEGQVYPNIETGFGVLNIKRLFEILNQVSSEERRKREVASKKVKGSLKGLFISIPKELCRRLKDKIIND